MTIPSSSFDDGDPSRTREAESFVRKTRRVARAKLFAPSSALVPLAGVAVGAWLARARRSRRLGVGILVVSLGLGVLRVQFQRFFTEQADYQVESSDAGFEVRTYAPSIRAETTVEGEDWDQALREGFHRLAAYIFGNSEPREAGAPAKKVAMTSPVVASVGSDAASCPRTVAFVLPRAESRESLPTPRDPRVHLRVVPAQRIAALRFSGRYGGSRPAEMKKELLARLHAQGLRPIGEVVFAGYDPPSTLPWLRRNEVLVEVDSRPDAHTGA